MSATRGSGIGHRASGVVTSAARDLLFPLFTPLCALAMTALTANAQSPIPDSRPPIPEKTYYAIVGSEGNDDISGSADDPVVDNDPADAGSNSNVANL